MLVHSLTSRAVWLSEPMTCLPISGVWDRRARRRLCEGRRDAGRGRSGATREGEGAETGEPTEVAFQTSCRGLVFVRGWSEGALNTEGKAGKLDG